MKLSKLFLISLATCTLVSCSKDDDISGPSEVDAYISIAASTDVMTKSYTKGGGNQGDKEPSNPPTDPGTGKEAVVKSLTAYVFDTADKWVVTKHVAMAVNENGQKFAEAGVSGEDYTINESGSINSIKGIHVKVARPSGIDGTSTSVFKVVLLANIEPFTVTSLDDLKTKSIPIITTYSDLNDPSKAVGKTYLPMHNEGEPLNIGGLKPSQFDKNGKEIKHVLNWYLGSGSSEQEELDLSNGDEVHTGSTSKGTAVKLIRSISRVQLKSLNASFVSQYTSYVFWVKSIYLANVRVHSTVLGEEDKSVSFYRGAPEEFTKIQYLIEKESTVVSELKKEYSELGLNNNITLNALGFDTYVNVNSPTSWEGIILDKEGQITGGTYQTRLIIEGTLKDGSDNPLGTKYFHIPLKMKDVNGNVACNKFFQITATITGEGNPNPDEILENTCINFKIDVQDWSVVDQKENDVN